MNPTQAQIKAAMAYQAPSGHKLRDYVPPRPKRKTKPKRDEDILQIACCDLLHTLPATLFWSNPNHLYLGSNASYNQRAHYMAKQKRMGLLPGVSDITIVFRNWDGQTTIVVPELKVGANQLTETQHAFANAANNVGCYTGVVRSIECLVALLKAAKHPCFR